MDRQPQEFTAVAVKPPLEERVNRDCLQHKPKNQDRSLQILNCVVCLGRVVNAHMCPNCSKMGCQNCLKEWVDSHKGECPCCRKPTRSRQLVNCSNLARELQEKIQLLMKKEQEEQQCRRHKSRIQYWCKNCKLPICSQCAMFEPDHRGHDFDKLANVMGQLQEQHRAYATLLGKKRNLLTTISEDVTRAVEQLRLQKEDRNAELERFTSGLASRIEKEYEQAQQSLQTQDRIVQGQWEQLKGLHQQINGNLLCYSKSQLVLKESELVQEIIKSREQLIFQQVKIGEKHILNQLVPTYEQKTFILRNYSQLRKSKDPVYTQPFKSRNLEWRLKIYPNGSESSQDMYISIYVELCGVEGPTTAQESIGKYKYQVEVRHPTNPAKKISREFESQFELGECWGYTAYAKLTDLAQDGYLGQNDSLEVVLNIKASSFYYQVVDLDRMLNVKKKQYQLNRQRLVALKQQLNLQIETDPSQLQDVDKVSQRSMDGGSLISLDDIREINGNVEIDDSPRIEDHEIFAKVLFPTKSQPTTAQCAK